jgi:hypothetical protein
VAGDKHDWLNTRAHAIWEAEGAAHGRDLDHWAQAEREYDAEQSTAVEAAATADEAATETRPARKRAR